MSLCYRPSLCLRPVSTSLNLKSGGALSNSAHRKCKASRLSDQSAPFRTLLSFKKKYISFSELRTELRTEFILLCHF